MSQRGGKLTAVDRVVNVDIGLVCRVETRLCALLVAHVREIMRPLPVEPLAGMPRFVRGVAVIRGAPIPVVDAATLLGAASFGQPGRFVTLRANDHSVALAVDEVLGLRELSAASIRDLPPLLRRGGDDIASTIGTLDAQLLVVLQAARVLPDSAWHALVAGGGLA